MTGWMDYLGLDCGYVARSKSPDAHKQIALEAIGEKLNVHIATITPKEFDLDTLPDPPVAVPDDVRNALIVVGRYGRIAQRQCLSDCQSFIKSQPSLDAFQVAKEYR